ncbi:MAG TPA: TatD family hydrolase [Chitinispirillaceae bacterium]|nr:TatD family hydrolase [Chitinispirillaceae bacterium]
MRLFDSHCHLQDSRIIDELHLVMDRAQKAGVSAMLCCGCSERDWETVFEISKKFDSVIPAFGMHPWYIGERSGVWLDKLESLLKSVPKAAVGEIGLDYTLKTGNEKEQLSVFADQLRLAARLQRPVSIHCRKAWGNLLELLKEEKGIKQGGAIHSYSGAPQLVTLFQKLGLYISFSGSVTSKSNLKVRTSLAEVDSERLLIESDSPDLLPWACIGYNEPANLSAIAKEISLLLNWSVEMVSETTYRNGIKLFQR